jgi:hypothetical protein
MASIKWIIGYIDWSGAIFAYVVREGNIKDSHGQLWTKQDCSSWKVAVTAIKNIPLKYYGEDMYRVMHRIEKPCEVY